MSCQQVLQSITKAAKSIVASEDQDPYVFTETVPTTPPILFNAQKSRTTRVFIDTQTLATTTTTTTFSTPSATPKPTAHPTSATETVAAAFTSAVGVTQKRQTPTPTPPPPTTANANKFKLNQKLPLGPLNGNNTKTQTASTTLATPTGLNRSRNGFAAAAAAGATAATKAAALSPTIVKSASGAQVYNQQQQQQQHKKALNVCIVRPQQQQHQRQHGFQARQQQQQHLKAQQQQQRKKALSPPPLLQHTPSLWQTPLLLDTASAVVSPPTSPASLPSPPATGLLSSTPTPTPATTPSLASPPTATLVTAATAMVSPLIAVAAAPPTTTTLPPSNFHHNTLAQHLQKVECLKKPKKYSANNDGSTTGKSAAQQEQHVIHKAHPQAQQQPQPQPQPQLQLQSQPHSQSQPRLQPRQRDLDAKTVVVPPTTVLLPLPPPHAQPHLQAQHKPIIATPSAPPPLQAIQAFAAPTPQQHSDSDLNEIPVNVIFRKPQTNEILHSKLGGNIKVTAVGGNLVSSTPSDRGGGNTPVAKDTISTVEAAKKSKGVRTLTPNTKTPPPPSPAPSPKRKSVAETAKMAHPPKSSSQHPAPHVLRDVVFTQSGTVKFASHPTNEQTSTLTYTHQQAPHQNSSAAVAHKQQQQLVMSSMAKQPALPPPPPPPPSSPQLTTQTLKYDSTSNSTAQLALHTTVGMKNMRTVENFSPATTAVTQQRVITTVQLAKTPPPPTPNTAFVKTAPKRKLTYAPAAADAATGAATNHMPSPVCKKRNRKMLPLYSALDNEAFLNAIATTNTNATCGNSHAVAVIKMSAAEIEADTSLLASDAVLPYCIQKHWLHITRELQLFGVAVGGGAVAAAGAVGVGGAAPLSLASSSLSTLKSKREARITHRKLILRRQALQLISTNALQKLPMQAAKRRLMCVDRLLRKYQQHGSENEIIADKQCNYVDCSRRVLAMAEQCEEHIVENMSQHIFLPCTAKFSDQTQCRVPVFDIVHDLPLCDEHARKRDAYNRRVVTQEQQQRSANHKLASAVVAATTGTVTDAGELLFHLKQIQQQHFYNNNNVAAAVGGVGVGGCTVVAAAKNKRLTNVKITAARKRKASTTTLTSPAAAAAAARPQKRAKKMLTAVNCPPAAAAPAAAVAPMQFLSATTATTTTIMQRKSSNTSLESIASNSQSSNSQAYYMSAQHMSVQAAAPAKIAMPALAPLSGRNVAPIVSSSSTLAPKLTTTAPTSMASKKHAAALSFSVGLTGNGGGSRNNDRAVGANQHINNNNDVILQQDLKPHEISQLVAQFSVAVNGGSNSNNTNNNNNCNNINYNNINANNHRSSLHANENSNSLNAFSNNFNNIHHHHLNNNNNNSCNNLIGMNSDSNFTSALGSSSSLPSSTEELFHQELLSVCENSSVYASSEDTGLGGLSETELMGVGPHDADDIPLGDTRLLEEHDLANVLSTLPEDAFNELFTAVHQEEREEVERALELADKHLKSLQQTIGTDIDFLGDFPDDDEILADTDAIVSSVMRSPDATSGIDTSTLFIDSGSNSVGGGGGNANATNITDIRGLVQT